ncbi:MAG: shikimate dehydrogenase [Ignavibacteriales bacterium]|nr:shikimate dehydrogenase [Ignavibacteriales bacterium]
MKRLALIGQPLGHSLSPLMFQTAFDALRIVWNYELKETPAFQLTTCVHELVEQHFAGFNITIPHKQQIIPLLDTIDNDARSIGAVNTVSIQEKKLFGTNTDVIGVAETLRPYERDIESQRVLILGAGGAARAAVFALAKSFKPDFIWIAARDKHKGESILKNMNCSGEVVPFDGIGRSAQFMESKLVVNTTPIGLHPHDNESPLGTAAEFQSHQLAFDVVYRPRQTKFLSQAHNAGANTIGGLEMFIQQGAAAFKLWTGQQMPTAAVRAQLEQQLTTEKENVV